MVIHTYEHDYPISSVKETNDTYDCYICRDMTYGGFCRVMSIKDRACFPELVSWLTEAVNTNTFTDYVEHFNFDGALCIVMKYTQGLTLRDKLTTEGLSVLERAEIGRRILEKVVLEEIPAYFLDKCMDPDQIIIAPDLTVDFNYPIDDIVGNRDCDPMPKVEKVLRLIFAREIDRKVPDTVVRFFDKLPFLLDTTVIEIYSEYHDMLNDLTELPEGDEEPKSFWYKLWDKLKKIWAVLKKFLMLGLVIAATVYLIMTINDTKSSTSRKANFDRIGTVTIDKTM